MSVKLRAVFKKRNGEIEVYCVGQDNDNGMYLGTLDPTEEVDYIYEGTYVFNLANEQITKETGAESIHIPVNVLREIADYEVDLLGARNAKSNARKRTGR